MENLNKFRAYFIAVTLVITAISHSVISQRQFSGGNSAFTQTGSVQQSNPTPECGIQDIRDEFDFHAAAPWAAALFYVEGDVFSNNLKQEYLSTAILLSRDLAITSTSRHFAQQKTGLESNLQLLYGHRRAAKQTFLRIRKVEPLVIREPLALKVGTSSSARGKQSQQDRESASTKEDAELYLLFLESPIDITPFSRPVCVSDKAFLYKNQYFRETTRTKKLHLSGYAGKNDSTNAQHGVFFSPDSEWKVQEWNTENINVIEADKQLTYDMLPKNFKPGSALTFKMNHQFFLVGILLKTSGSQTTFRSLEKFVDMIHLKQSELSQNNQNPTMHNEYTHSSVNTNGQNSYVTTAARPNVPGVVLNDQKEFLMEIEKSEFEENSDTSHDSSNFQTSKSSPAPSVLTERPERYNPTQSSNQYPYVQPSGVYQVEHQPQQSPHVERRPQVSASQYLSQPQQSPTFASNPQPPQSKYGSQTQSQATNQFARQPQPGQTQQSSYLYQMPTTERTTQPQYIPSIQQIKSNPISTPVYYPPGGASELERPPSHHATCSQSYTEGVDIECISRPRGISNEDCIKRAPANTTIRLSCKNHYVPLQGAKVIEQTCDPHGKWIPRIPFGCKLDCGTINKGVPYIVQGSETIPEKWPWHAALFKLVNETSYSYICGATLITRSILVTAAHCVHDGANRLVHKNLFRVVVGAISSNLLVNRNDPQAQEFSIREIRVNEHYSSRNYEADIALLQINKSVRLTEYVRPVCYPSPGNDNKVISSYQLSEGSKGVVVGFGTTLADSGISKTLRMATLPYVSVRNCTSVLERSPLSTQYCAGYTNGTSVCEGDSGGAHVFEDTTSKRYYIQGIISHGNRKDSAIGKSRCDNEKYTVFTKVGAFTEWMQDVIYKIDLDYNRRRRK